MKARMEIVKVQGIEKTYGSGGGQVSALRGVDLTLDKGAFAAVTGASGSGKSTLLHILGGVEKATAGTVTVDGQDVGKMNRTQAALYRRRTVGLVYQFFNLVPTLTLEKNILLPLRLDGKKPDMAYLRQVTEALGIADRLDSLPGELSGGQRQRAAIARSLLYRPALLLADEPTGSLDRENAREVMDMLDKSNREFGQTILLVTHDSAVAERAHRVITLSDGQIVEDRITEVRS